MHWNFNGFGVILDENKDGGVFTHDYDLVLGTKVTWNEFKVIFLHELAHFVLRHHSRYGLEAKDCEIEAWLLVKEVAPRLYEKNIDIIEKWYKSYKDAYPHAVRTACLANKSPVAQMKQLVKEVWSVIYKEARKQVCR